MIDGLRVLGVIPARGGSKGVVGKNLRDLAGKPLLAWTIEAAQRARLLDRVILSSEDDAIIDVARRFDCEVPFKRPPHLAEDDTPGVEPVIHAVDSVPGFDYVVLLQPTSPLRLSSDIDAAIEACVRREVSSCVSVVALNKPLAWMRRMRPDGRLEPVLDPGTPVLRRQEAEPIYAFNGAIYVNEIETLRRTRRLVTEDTIAYVMPFERSVDIDTEADLQLCEFLLTSKRPGATAEQGRAMPGGPN